MLLVTGSRKSGKTVRLLETAKKEGAVFLCKDRKDAEIFERYAKELGWIDMPPPMAYSDFLYSLPFEKPKKIIIDDLVGFTSYITGDRLIAASINGVRATALSNSLEVVNDPYNDK